MIDPGYLRMHACIGLAQLVQPGKHLRGSLQRIHSGVGPRGVCRAAFDAHFQMQAAVVGHDDAVAEARADGVIRPGQTLRQQPPRTHQATGFLVVREVQFHRAIERGTAGCERPQCKGVGGDVGLRQGDAASVHHPIADLSAVGIRGPACARLHHIAMGVQRNDRAVPETLAHHQIGRADHAIRPYVGFGHHVTFHGEAQTLQQPGGALRMRRTVAGRIVGRHAHQLRQELHLVGKAGIHEASELRICTHVPIVVRPRARHKQQSLLHAVRNKATRAPGWRIGYTGEHGLQ